MHKNVLITGATGLIGTRLTTMLGQNGHRVSHLSRGHRPGTVPTYQWDVGQGKMDARAVEGTEAIVHLAGAGIADKRWTAGWKKEILESRVRSAGLLYETLQRETHQVKTFVSASAIGIYGEGGPERTFTEMDGPANGFLAEVVRQWEEAAGKFSALGIRVVKIRIGILLSGRGGALPEMAWPVRWCIGSPLGPGNQVLSWVHIDDVCRLFIKAIEEETMHGAYNAVAPAPVDNREMVEAIARVLRKPLWAPNVPGFILKLMLGEMSELVLKGNLVSSQKAQRQGFEFKHAHLEGALRDLLA